MWIYKINKCTKYANLKRAVAWLNFLPGFSCSMDKWFPNETWHFLVYETYSTGFRYYSWNQIPCWTYKRTSAHQKSPFTNIQCTNRERRECMDNGAQNRPDALDRHFGSSHWSGSGRTTSGTVPVEQLCSYKENSMRTGTKIYRRTQSLRTCAI